MADYDNCSLIWLAALHIYGEFEKVCDQLDPALNLGTCMWATTPSDTDIWCSERALKSLLDLCSVKPLYLFKV